AAFTVLAAVGEDASLSCLLLETKDVQQVTWQKVLGNKERNIGSYSEYFGQTVNSDFKDKVQFTEAGLQKTSIVIRNVTEQDRGCYLCLFNTYPDGALTAETCLKVYGESQTVLQGFLLELDADHDVVSCSATGRPAPTVTLTVPQQNLSLSLYNTTRVSNSNGTVTVTTTALLRDTKSTDGFQMSCLALPLQGSTVLFRTGVNKGLVICFPPAQHPGLASSSTVADRWNKTSYFMKM
uniref:Ig-like domain-containing protein n=1 Tax=Fundulus heteroclitus TaxID=8078 RepID=A0A3Q2PV49_FUNHE